AADVAATNVAAADIASADVAAPDVAAADVTPPDVPATDITPADVAAADITTADVERHRTDGIPSLRVDVVAADRSASADLIQTQGHPVIRRRFQLAVRRSTVDLAVEVDVLRERRVGNHAVGVPVDRTEHLRGVDTHHAAAAIRTIQIVQLRLRELGPVA